MKAVEVKVAKDRSEANREIKSLKPKVKVAKQEISEVKAWAQSDMANSLQTATTHWEKKLVAGKAQVVEAF